MRRFPVAFAIAVAAWVSGWAADGAPVARPRNPPVRVVSISQDRLDRGTPALLEETLDRMEQAMSFRPDIVCLPEHFADQAPEAVPGGTVTERIRGWARKHAVYVIFGLARQDAGRAYNSAVVVGRGGEIIGIYDKIHPTEGEIAAGVTPGNPNAPVFDTEFGRIGIQICFDVNWWDTWALLKKKGAQLIFFPSAYPAARQASALALRNQVFVVTSPQSGAGRIYDVTGTVLAESGKYQRWIGAELPLGKRVFEIDFHIQKMREIQRKYGQRVQIEWSHDDDWVTLASLDPDLTVEDLIREYDLLPLDEYRERACKAIGRAREKAGAESGSRPLPNPPNVRW